MIASTSTCSRRTSSWRITSPSCFCTSAGAEITMALAPSKREITARPPPMLAPGTTPTCPAPASAGCAFAVSPAGAAAAFPAALPEPAMLLGGSTAGWLTAPPCCPTSCCNTGSSIWASACFRNTTRTSLPLAAALSRSATVRASSATSAGSPRSATLLELSIGTTPTFAVASPPRVAWVSSRNDVASSRAPACLSGTTCVTSRERSMLRSMARTRRTLSA